VDDAIEMVFTCKDCGLKFLSSPEFELHKQTHYLDKWSSKPDKTNWKAPDGLNPDSAAAPAKGATAIRQGF
jgi:hypothetical protein